MASVKLPELASGALTLHSILPISVLQWLVILAGFKTEGITAYGTRVSIQLW